MAKSGLRRFFYKRILPGDVAKLRAESNTQQVKTGGGARDLRFGPWKDWESFVHNMFPTTGSTTKNGKTVQCNDLYWLENGQEQHKTVEFWPPTDSRPSEGRLATIHELPPYAPAAMPQAPGAEVLFFMCERADGKIFGEWMTTTDLQNGKWHADVANPILKQLKKATATANVRGWVDLASGQEMHFGA